MSQLKEQIIESIATMPIDDIFYDNGKDAMTFAEQHPGKMLDYFVGRRERILHIVNTIRAYEHSAMLINRLLEYGVSKYSLMRFVCRICMTDMDNARNFANSIPNLANTDSHKALALMYVVYDYIGVV